MRLVQYIDVDRKKPFLSVKVANLELRTRMFPTTQKTPDCSSRQQSLDSVKREKERERERERENVKMTYTS